MTTIKSILNQFAPDYIEQNASKMPTIQRKAIAAICNCRSEHFGIAVFECDQCKKHHTVFRCCGNRHCPGCQHHKQHLWLNRRIQRQLPGHHFMVTFTVPEALRNFIYRHQRDAYEAMFKASADTIKKLTAKGSHIGGDLPGFFGALHTWGSQLQYHPHIHYVVAGGAYCNTTGNWAPARIDFLLPVKVMSKVFKAKFADLMMAKGLYDQIPAKVWTQGFNVDCRAVGSGQRSVTYLSRYLFKVAISDGRILKIDGNRVYFKYRVKDSNRLRTTSLEVMAFIARFLKHVLPKGFVKVRYFGLYNANCSQPMTKIAFLIEAANDFELPNDKPEPKELPPFCCPNCKNGTLSFVCQILPYKMLRAGVG
jgi:hypothetical protein